MLVNLNDRKFTPAYNSINGEVSEKTVFHYHQDGNMIWAEYSGGQIIKGTLMGKSR
jgi:hypothetical protein